ncbi:serine hydrolase domain-containing protein [Winogradskyella sp.]|uniref:serine hydrolase domain-containing protein n=1 Tax=Winogradskyella sp. TaxID=1883156 RepID=UPI0026110B36|nr:serine hydrolase domain-containing protein [Winogradskyella sp.]
MKNNYICFFMLLIVFTILACESSSNPEDFKAKNIDKVREIINSYDKNLGFSGNILIGQGDSIIYHSENGFSDYGEKKRNASKTKFRLASLSKQFTAAALLVLEQQRKVDFNEPLSTYIKELKPEIADKITIHQILSHSSGLGRDIETLSNKPLGQSYITLDEIIKLINTSDLYYEPGKKWSYSNLGYAVAAKIIEEVSGMDYGDAMKELIFQPLGMYNTGHESSKISIDHMAKGYVDMPEEIIDAMYEDKSYVIGAGSIYSTTEDMFTWARELMNGGKVINEKSRKKLFSKQGGRGYSYGWYVANYVWSPVNEKTQAINIHHDGGCPGFSSKLSILSKHNLVIIVLSNKVPAHISTIANKVTNTVLGFEYEGNAKENHNKAFFDILFEQGIEALVSTEIEWKSSKPDYYVPSSSDIFLIGRGYLESNDYQKAYKVMDYLIHTSPEWTYPYLFKGFGKEEEGKREEAVSLYKKVLEIDPKQSNALGRLKQLKN